MSPISAQENIPKKYASFEFKIDEQFTFFFKDFDEHIF